MSARVFNGLLACAVSVLAQGGLPQGFDKQEGATFTAVPFQSAPSRVQFGYSAWATRWTAPRTIQELWMRPDRGGRLTRALRIELEVEISSQGCDPETQANDWSKNHGTDRTVFMKKRVFDIPVNGSPSSPVPRPWLIQLKGDRPFVASSPTLVVDISSYKPISGNGAGFVIDAASTTPRYAGTRGSSSPYGQSCSRSTTLGPNGGSGLGLEVGKTLSLSILGLQGGEIVMNWLASSFVNVRIPNLTGCWLHAPIEIVHPTQPKAIPFGGVAQFRWGVIPQGLAGARIYSQCLWVDPNSHVVGMSPGLQMQVGDYRRLPTFSSRWNDDRQTPGFDPDRDPAARGLEDRAMIFDVR